MKKNVAGQKIGAQMCSATDGSAFTSAVTVYVTGDAGTQAVGSVGAGACTHEGNGYHTYAPAQAETNYDLIAFTFIGTGAIPATVQIFSTFPQTGDSFGLIGTAGAGLTNINLPDQTMNITGDITGNLSGSVGSVTGSVGSVTGNVGGNVVGTVASVVGAVGSVTGAVGSVTGNVGGNVTGSVGSVTGLTASNLDVASSTLATAANLAVVAGYLDTEIAAIKAKTDNLPAAPAAVSDIPTAAQNADAVWDEAIAGHAGAGSTGEALSAAAAAGDPWTTALPGAYGAGSAGYLVGTNLDAAVSSRLAPTVAARTLDVSATGEAGIDWANVGGQGTAVNLSATNIDVDQVVASVSGAVGSVTGAVGSVTGNVGGNVTGSVGSVTGLTASNLDVASSTLATAANLATVAGYIDTEIAAIKAKTDNLPAAPAAVSDIPTAVQNADTLLNRDMSLGADDGSPTVRTVRQALRFLRNKFSIAGSTLTVTKEDDTTASWTAAVTTDAAALPITGSDPAS